MGYIICPYCGKECSQLKQHCTRTHKLKWEQVQSEYPGIRSSSEELFKKRSEHMKILNETPGFREKIPQRTEAKVEASRRNLDIINKDPLKRKEVNKLASDRWKSWNSSEEGRRVRSQCMKKYHAEHPGLYTGFHGKPVLVSDKDGNKIRVRSLLEMRILQELRNRYNVEMKYEALKVPYLTDDGESHTYYPDFLIDNKIVLEVKPASQVGEKVVLLKRKATESLGYDFYFVTCPEDLSKIPYLVQRLSKA